MTEVKEIEKRIKSIKGKIGKGKAGATTPEGILTLRSLKKRLRRAQRKRRALVSYDLRIAQKQESKEKKAKEPKAEPEGGKKETAG